MLHFVGTQGTGTSWFRHYQTKQKAEIKSSKAIKNSYRNWGTMKHWGPQGSVLGLLLFRIYINDLPPEIKLSLPVVFGDEYHNI